VEVTVDNVLNRYESVSDVVRFSILTSDAEEVTISRGEWYIFEDYVFDSFYGPVGPLWVEEFNTRAFAMATEKKTNLNPFLVDTIIDGSLTDSRNFHLEMFKRLARGMPSVNSFVLVGTRWVA